MKTIQIKMLFVAVFFGALFTLLYSCDNTNATNNESAANTKNIDQEKKVLPQVLIRTGALSESEEWQKTIVAVAKVNQRIEKNPNDYKARIILAEIFINEARITGEHGYYYPAILKILNGLLANDNIGQEVKFNALSLKSAVLLSLHQFQQAKEVAEQAVKINPDNAQIYGALTDANVELGNYEEAVQMATKMMDLRPDLLSYSRASYLREIYGDPNGAIEAMKLAVESGFPGFENMAWSRLTLGNIYENNGNLTEAEMQYRIALEERPGYPFAIAALASVERKKGNLAEAEKLLNTAIEIIPEVSFYVDLASVYQQTGREQKAKETIEEIKAMMADDEANGHDMSLEYARVFIDLKKDYKSALAKAMGVYEKRPANIDVNKLMAEIHMHLNNIEKAEEHLAVAMRTNSQDYALLMIASKIYEKQGNKELAMQMKKKSMEINPYQENKIFAQKQVLN
ncbi:MAG: tetratricopeptide repeat protein [Bacteroidia bacterium]